MNDPHRDAAIDERFRASADPQPGPPVAGNNTNVPSLAADTPPPAPLTERDAPDQPLFRLEALEARRTQYLGPVLLLPHRSHTLFALLALAAVAGLFALLFFGEYTRKAQLNGWLVPERGLVQVYAPQGGVITKLEVSEGATVREGDPLFVISAERRSTAIGGGTEAEIARLLGLRRDSLESELQQQQQLLAQQRAGLARRLAAIRNEISQFDSEIAVQEARRDLAITATERMRGLQRQGFASQMQLQKEEENELDQRARLRALQRTRAERQRELAALQAEYDDLPLRAKSQASAVERSISELEQEAAVSESRRTVVVTAPQSGTVTALLANIGANASTATPLASIVPEGSKLEAHLYTPSRSIGFIQPGQQVLLRYQAFPYQKFGHHTGTVVAVSTSALSPSELPVQQAGLTSLVGTGEPVYRITVAIDQQQIVAYGEPRALQPGMQLQSDILLERRKLYEWLLEPLYTLTGKL
ncbi:HlyD family secretion protein [Piscinibacter sakaiensis]|uniref:HlyD family secretion protein n=1 Tax=Piscinibacter sakaiensis TaxID=1547922 RepID=UPI003AAFF042